jgi:predicted tellurium resistance membrane protein TerC
MTRMDRFLKWACAVSHGPNGTPSSARVVGLLSATVLQAVFIYASAMLIHRGENSAFLETFKMFAIFVAVALGLVTAPKIWGNAAEKKETP